MPENNNRNIEGRSDKELLELLLRSESQASEILKIVTLSELSKAHRQELGLTPNAYERLQVSIELGRRIQESKAKFKTPNKINSSSDAIDFCKNHFARLISDCLQEEFHIVSLNTKNHVIQSHQVTVGTLDASLVHPREVFRPAIKDSA